MIASLHQQRCFNHAVREAVARCPECGQCFCRECITEHDGRVLCSNCLKKLARAPRSRRPFLGYLWRLAQCAAGIVIAWFFFFLAGQSLVKIPSAYHEGTLWHAQWLDDK